MRKPLGDRERLGHMVEAMGLMEEFTAGIDYETYQRDLMRRLALVKLLENIGEAATAISEDLKTEFSDVEWRTLKSVRNILTHEYFGINYEIVWNSIQADVPPLKTKIERILRERFGES
jgi:uncharacterized protein with HEPN domain